MTLRKEITPTELDAIAEYAFNQIDWSRAGFGWFAKWEELPEATKIAYRAMVKSTIQSLIEHVEPEND